MVVDVAEAEPWPPMPADAEEGYRLYAGAAGRNARQVARLLNVPFGTVASWSSRYRWGARIQSEDLEAKDARIATAHADLAALLPAAVATVKAILAGGFADAPRAAVELRAAFGTLDRFGLSPIQHATLDVTAHRAEALPVSTEELARLAAVGDVQTLLALAAGRPLPDPEPDPAPIETTARVLPASIATPADTDADVDDVDDDLDVDDDDLDVDDDELTPAPPTLQGGRQDFSRESGKQGEPPEPDSVPRRNAVSFGGSGRRWGPVANPRIRSR